MNEKTESILFQLSEYLHNFNYLAVEKYIQNQDHHNQQIISFLIESFDLFYIISSHKIRLADYVLIKSRVDYLPEDRTRVVFLLAKYYNSNFKAVELAFKSEFGEFFVFLENYQIGRKIIPWKKMALKAKSIKNAYRNLDMLRARVYLNEISYVYRSFKESDAKKLQQIVDLSELFLAAEMKRKLDPGKDIEIDGIRSVLSTMLKLCGWLDIETKKVNTTLDFEKYEDFVSKIQYVCVARLYLLYNNKPIDNYAEAEEILLSYLANVVALSYRADSIIRKSVKLKPKLAHKTAKASNGK